MYCLCINKKRFKDTSQLSLIFFKQKITTLEELANILVVSASDIQIWLMRSSKGQARAVTTVIKLFTSSSLQNVNLPNTSLLFSE